MIARTGILALALAAAGAATQAEPNTAQYELQARCGRDAAAFFKRFDDGDPPPVSFTNHYNPDLNGCFALLKRTRFETGKGITWIGWELWDVNENRQIDVIGWQPSFAEKDAVSASRSAAAQAPLDACMSGNFLRCADLPGFEDYVRGFARSVMRYMQRSAP